MGQILMTGAGICHENKIVSLDSCTKVIAKENSFPQVIKQ